MKDTYPLLLLSLAIVSCGSDRDTSTPPPPPPLPSSDVAYRAALAAGPGTCRDLETIRVLPFKGELGYDKSYDRIAVHIDSYRECLIKAILDTTPIKDPGEGPKRAPYAVGDLAFNVLTATGQIRFSTCIPQQVQRQVDEVGVMAFQEWLHSNANRASLHRCVVEQLAPNNSFKPKPLRGSA